MRIDNFAQSNTGKYLLLGGLGLAALWAWSRRKSGGSTSTTNISIIPGGGGASIPGFEFPGAPAPPAQTPPAPVDTIPTPQTYDSSFRTHLLGIGYDWLPGYDNTGTIQALYNPDTDKIHLYDYELNSSWGAQLYGGITSIPDTIIKEFPSWSEYDPIKLQEGIDDAEAT